MTLLLLLTLQGFFVEPRTSWDPMFAGFDGEVVYANDGVFCQHPPLSWHPPLRWPKATACGGPWLGSIEAASDASIVVHHSDFDDAPGPLVIRNYHLQVSRFADIGYHFVVSPDGRIFEGRPAHLLGAHAGISKEGRTNKRLDPDHHAIGIVLDGNYNIATPPDAQVQALAWLVGALRQRYGVEGSRIYGHRHVRALVEQRGLTFDGDPTTCPGDGAVDLVPWLRGLALPERP
jgi:hypothetical protein